MATSIRIEPNLLFDVGALRAMIYLLVSQMPEGRATIRLDEAFQSMVMSTGGRMEMRYQITDDELLLETRK